MMLDTIKIKPVNKKTIDAYIEIGKRSYKEHYLHLWENQDPSPYIDKSFTRAVLEDELTNANSRLFIIYSDELPVGILKIVIDHEIGDYSAEQALLLQKIYLLKEFSGNGIGSKILNFTENFAKERNKKAVWLDAMKKGPALGFYLKKGFEILKEVRHPSPKVLAQQCRMYILTKKV